MDINELRKKIDEIDSEVKKLLSKRFELVKQIGEKKNDEKIKAIDTKRESQVIDEFVKDVDEQEKQYYEKIIRTIISTSRDMQKKKPLIGSISVNADKSATHRALILASLANGESIIKGDFSGEDINSTIGCLKSLGIKIQKKQNEIRIHGRGMYGLTDPKTPLNAHNSATTMRLLCGILSVQQFDTIIDGDSSLRKRPMNRVAVPLNMMGADIEGDAPPLKIKGQRILHGISYTLPVPSAQVKAAIMMAGMFAGEPSCIVERMKTRSHTEFLMKEFGVRVDVHEKDANRKITVYPTKELKACKFDIPGDFSSAAYLICAALLVSGSKITIQNVQLGLTQDGLLTVLSQMGARINRKGNDLEVEYSYLRGIKVNEKLVPSMIDEIPILAVVASFAKGDTTIHGIRELRYKESDRIDAIKEELLKAGVQITASEDWIKIQGENADNVYKYKLENSHGDHRIAMAMNIFELVINGEVTKMKETEVSFPEFYEKISALIQA